MKVGCRDFIRRAQDLLERTRQTPDVIKVREYLTEAMAIENGKTFEDQKISEDAHENMG